jgi:hypothetical protein
MNAHWERRHRSGATALLLAALLSVSGAMALAAPGGAIEDPAEADRILLERSKVAKQIVVEGQPGTLQAEQEKQALQRAQEGWQNMDGARAASAQRRASWEAAKQEAARLQEQRQAKYWESTLNMERLLARQQEIEATRQRNLEIDQQRTLKDWNVVGDATEAGFQEQQRREEVRKENLRRYQESLQSGWGAAKPQDGQTAQQAFEADRQKREQVALQYNLSYWNQVNNNTESGRQQQDALEKARRDLQLGHLRERLKEWDTIGSAEESGLRDQSAREQARRANAERYQQQLREEYNASRVAGQAVTTPGAAPSAAAPATAPGTPSSATPAR